MGKKLLITIIPLILTIGIVPALPFVEAVFESESVSGLTNE